MRSKKWEVRSEKWEVEWPRKHTGIHGNISNFLRKVRRAHRGCQESSQRREVHKEFLDLKHAQSRNIAIQNNIIASKPVMLFRALLPIYASVPTGISLFTFHFSLFTSHVSLLTSYFLPGWIYSSVYFHGDYWSFTFHSLLHYLLYFRGFSGFRGHYNPSKSQLLFQVMNIGTA